MSSRKFAYVRVSSNDQNIDRQMEALKNFVPDERDIFIDKISGRNFNRDQYQLMKRMLREGDTLYIHSLDRFGRNKDQILNEWEEITKKIKADIIVLDMPLLDTTKYKDSLGTLISDLVLQILSWLAEEERNKIRSRQREGIDLALKNGKKFGRPEVEITEEFIEAYNRWKNGELTASAAIIEYDIKRTTFYRLAREYEESNCG